MEKKKPYNARKIRVFNSLISNLKLLQAEYHIIALIVRSVNILVHVKIQVFQ